MAPAAGDVTTTIIVDEAAEAEAEALRPRTAGEEDGGRTKTTGTT